MDERNFRATARERLQGNWGISILTAFVASLLGGLIAGNASINLNVFEDILVDQVRRAVAKCEGEFKVHKSLSRIYVEALTDFDYDELIDTLKYLDISTNKARDGSRLPFS